MICILHDDVIQKSWMDDQEATPGNTYVPTGHRMSQFTGRSVPAYPMRGTKRRLCVNVIVVIVVIITLLLLLFY